MGVESPKSMAMGRLWLAVVLVHIMLSSASSMGPGESHRALRTCRDLKMAYNASHCCQKDPATAGSECPVIRNTYKSSECCQAAKDKMVYAPTWWDDIINTVKAGGLLMSDSNGREVCPVDDPDYACDGAVSYNAGKELVFVLPRQRRDYRCNDLPIPFSYDPNSKAGCFWLN